MMTVLYSFLVAVAAFGLLVVSIGYLLSVRGYKGPVTDHFDGRRFRNPSGVPANGFKEVNKYVKDRSPDRWPSGKDYFVRSEGIPDIGVQELNFTFINHSSFLIQVQGLNILTDPIWSNRCSPFQFAGPSRMRPPGVSFDSMPVVDLVLITHNHYDHLDKNTIKLLNAHHEPTFVVPLGLVSLMKKWGCKHVIEMDWWQEQSVLGIKLSSTPANHFSSRGIFDRDKTLWCGYVIEMQNGQRIYYVGDTGYSDIFREVGTKYGPMDLSFIPIGAYKPEWFMSPIHISPGEAIQVHQDVRSKQSVAMHFGTFPLADDGPERAVRDLDLGIQLSGIEPHEFIVPQEGRSYAYDVDQGNLTNPDSNNPVA